MKTSLNSQNTKPFAKKQPHIDAEPFFFCLFHINPQFYYIKLQKIKYIQLQNFKICSEIGMEQAHN